MGSASATATIQDATARSSAPTVPLATSLSLLILNGSTQQRIAQLVAPALPPAGATVLTATLTLTQHGAADAGDRTVAVRRIQAPWKASTLTWANRPARVSAPTASAVVAGAGAAGRQVVLDVKADVQAWADGAAPNYGWTLEVSNGNKIAFRSVEAATGGPRLDVTWTLQPAAPTSLSPATGVVSVPRPLLRWQPTDVGGDTKQAAIQVHLKASADGWSAAGGFTSPSFDSGVVTTGASELDLAATSYAGLAAGETVWWTVRQRDDAGLWSLWSDPHSFGYQPHQSVTLNSPAATITDTTFPWSWTAATQTRYELQLLDQAGNRVWTSTIVSSATARAHQMARAVITRTGVPYTAVLRVWDDQPRQDIPGARAFVEVTRQIVYADTTAVAPVTNLIIEPLSGDLAAEATWRRSEMPDQFKVEVDGAEYAVVDGPDVFVSGTSYRLRLPGLAPRVSHTVVVKAVTTSTSNGVTTTRSSAANPTATVTLDPVGVLLVDPADPDGTVVILAADGDADELVETDMPEVVEKLEPLRSGRAVIVTSAARWFEGTLSGGTLADWGDVTADQYRARMLKAKGERTRTRILVWGTQAVPVTVYEVNVTERSLPGATRYGVGFSFVAAVASPEYTLS